jgi:hypothetical protein
MAILRADMSSETMTEVCAKALMTLLLDGEGVSLEHGGHKYMVHRDKNMLVVGQADSVPGFSDTVLWDPGFTGDADAYLGI